jgi:hypothetical protein
MAHLEVAAGAIEYEDTRGPGPVIVFEGRPDLAATGFVRHHPSNNPGGSHRHHHVVGLAIFLVVVLLSPETKERFWSPS